MGKVEENQTGVVSREEKNEMEMAFLGHVRVRERQSEGLTLSPHISARFGLGNHESKRGLITKEATFYLMLGREGKEKMQSPVPKAGEEDLGVALQPKAHQRL